MFQRVEIQSVTGPAVKTQHEVLLYFRRTLKSLYIILKMINPPPADLQPFPDSIHLLHPFLSACSLSEPAQHLLWTEGGVHSDEFVSGPGSLETNEGKRFKFNQISPGVFWKHGSHIQVFSDRRCCFLTFCSFLCVWAPSHSSTCLNSINTWWKVMSTASLCSF